MPSLPPWQRMTRPVRNSFVPTFEQHSAGGVVFRGVGPNIEVAIVLMVPELRWQLPKGIIDEGETIEQAALREVREESGLEAELIAPLDTIEYWFTAERDGELRRYHKFVHFFLMRYISGNVEDHDDEVAEARWVSVETAMDMLVFKNERNMVEKAAELIANSEQGI